MNLAALARIHVVVWGANKLVTHLPDFVVPESAWGYLVGSKNNCTLSKLKEEFRHVL
jgi:hypothetical protein